MAEIYRISSSEEKHKFVAERVLKYLLKHPTCEDTLEGIAEWWLEIHYIEESVEAVANALSYLCQQGTVLSEKDASGSTYYKLNFNKQEAL